MGKRQLSVHYILKLVLVKVSYAAIEHHDHKQLGERDKSPSASMPLSQFLLKGTQAGTETRTMTGSCLLAYSLWLAQCAQVSLPRVGLTHSVLGSTHLNH